MRTAHKLLCVPFWLAVLLAVLGCAITFFPGAECGWFLMVAVLSVSGFFIPKIFYRAAAGLLLILALILAYGGCRHGVEYRQWLSAHRAP